jgi:hypothetical protein
MNREWHDQHRMPDHATTGDRVQWHLEHTKNCACRPFPKGLMAKLSVEERQKVANSLALPQVPQLL